MKTTIQRVKRIQFTEQEQEILIWINEFKKSGYVRQAKILTSV